MKCIVKKGTSEEFIAEIVTEPHPTTNIIGLDLGDGFPLTYLAKVSEIEVL
jgi:hypothetical protein